MDGRAYRVVARRLLHSGLIDLRARLPPHIARAAHRLELEVVVAVATVTQPVVSPHQATVVATPFTMVVSKPLYQYR